MKCPGIEFPLASDLPAFRRTETQRRVGIRPEIGEEQIEQGVHGAHSFGVFGHEFVRIGRSGAHVRYSLIGRECRLQPVFRFGLEIGGLILDRGREFPRLPLWPM